jgi:PAS domain S-box-containing protein
MFFKFNSSNSTRKRLAASAAIISVGVRKDSEKRQAQIVVKYRQILEAASDPMVIVNQERVIVLLNLQAEKKFGYLSDELVGQKFTKIIPEGLWKALGLRSGCVSTLTGRRKDGSDFPIELTLRSLGSAEEILMIATIRSNDLIEESGRHLDPIGRGGPKQ